MPRVIDQTLFNLVHDFLEVHLPKHKQSSPHTIRSYRYALSILFDYVKSAKHISIGEITFNMLDDKTIVAFLEWLESQGCSAATRNHRLKCIRAFYSYAADMEPSVVARQLQVNKISWAKTVKSDLVEFLSEDAIDALFEQPDTTTEKGMRDRLFMVLLYDTAARVQEIIDLRLRDIRPGKAPTVILTGKGSKVRSVPIDEKTIHHIRSYMDVFHSGEDFYSDSYLFYVIRKSVKHPMSSDNVRKWMRKYGAATKESCRDMPEDIHPHLFRHSRAMHLYQGGIDLTLISQLLGHAHLETTLIYARADTELKRKALEKGMTSRSPLKKDRSVSRFDVNDDETLKKLYGMK